MWKYEIIHADRFRNESIGHAERDTLLFYCVLFLYPFDLLVIKFGPFWF